MKKHLRFLCVSTLAPALLLSSCVSPYYVGPNQAIGTVAGALTGAAAGGIIGHQSGSGLEGAAIGGVIGSWLGSLAGYSQDQYSYGYPPPRVVAAPVIVQPSFGYYSYGYRSCAPRYYHRSHCW